MKCPNCNVDLVMSERQGVEIDYCPQCRGVWLDRGELDKILERSATQLAPAAAEARPRERYDDDDYKKRYGHKKPRSFLHDLFD